MRRPVISLICLALTISCGNLVPPNSSDHDDARHACSIVYETLGKDMYRTSDAVANFQPRAVQHTIRVFVPVEPSAKKIINTRISTECNHKVKLVYMIYSGDKLQSETVEYIKPKNQGH